MCRCKEKRKKGRGQRRGKGEGGKRWESSHTNSGSIFANSPMSDIVCKLCSLFVKRKIALIYDRTRCGGQLQVKYEI